MSSWKWLQRNKIIFTAFIVWLCVFELFSKCLVGIGQTNIISFYSGNENSNKLYKCFKKHLAYLFQNLFLIEIALSLNYFTVYLMFFFLILFSVVTGITALLCLLRQRENVRVLLFASPTSLESSFHWALILWVLAFHWAY